MDNHRLYPADRMEYHSSICISSYDNALSVLHVYGTYEQIALLNKLCESLERGTLLQDMVRVLGVSGASESPSAVVYEASNWNPGESDSKVTPGTTPPPTLPPTGKSRPASVNRQGVGGGVKPANPPGARIGECSSCGEVSQLDYETSMGLLLCPICADK